MTGPDLQPAAESPLPDASTNQRKVRKGTRSCWECKRRKIRCIFPSAADGTCVSCQRRRVPCVGQEMPEALSPARKGNRYLGERIARVEDVMKDLLAGKDASTPGQSEDSLLQSGPRRHSDTSKARAYDSVPLTLRGPPTPAESPGEYVPAPLVITSSSPGASNHGEIDSTAFHPLLAAFPSDQDIKILLKECARSSRYTSLINTQPHSKLTHETLEAPYDDAVLPSPGAHPIILAKCMLMFAITLQSPCEGTLLGLSELPEILGRRLVAAATAWLATQDQTSATVEGLICIILEAVYETNCGNLRRAWVIYRKAMTVAQMMGLHRSPVPPLKFIDSKLDADPEFMWFRIVYMDRYLSLLLGLPQGTTDKNMGASSVLRREPPLGQFERLLTVVASCILERNENSFATSEISTTHSIDAELLKVSKSMPTSFWRPANFQNLTPGSPENLLETVRLAAQVYYYGLLIQLHVPYMMHGIGNNTEHEYSRITCVNASREILSRFVAHRSFNPKSACSRPVDFFAFLAAMTLLLAHLDAHHHRDSTNFLAHQRLSDRAILDQAVERMDIVSDVDKDTVSEKSAKWIRQLLDIEADAAEGNSYTASSVRRDEDDVPEPTAGKRCEELRLHIPYLGIIKIARQGLLTREPTTQSSTTFNPVSRPHQPAPAPQTSSLPHTLTSPSGPYQPLPQTMVPTYHHHQQQQQQHNTPTDQTQDHMSTQHHQPLHMPAYEDQCLLQYTSPSTQQQQQQDTHMSLHPPTMDLPTIDLDLDDYWAFQGVDMAFFDSLMRGTACGMEQ